MIGLCWNWKDMVRSGVLSQCPKKIERQKELLHCFDNCLKGTWVTSYNEGVFLLEVRVTTSLMLWCVTARLVNMNCRFSTRKHALLLLRIKGTIHCDCQFLFNAIFCCDNFSPHEILWVHVLILKDVCFLSWRHGIFRETAIIKIFENNLFEDILFLLIHTFNFWKCVIF